MSFIERLSKANAMREKYPDRVPVVIVPCDNMRLDTHKFLVQKVQTLASFLVSFRAHNKVALNSREAVFALVNNTLIPSSKTFAQIDHEYASEDGLVYIHVKKENTFGGH